MSGTDQEQHIPIDDLSAYLDGMIEDPDEERRIREHLSGCAVCRDELRKLDAVTQLLAELPEPEVPRSFRLSESDVTTRDNAPVPIKPWFIRYQSRFQAAAVAAVLVLAIVATVDFWPAGTGVETDDAADDPVIMDAPQEDAAQEAPLRESQETDDDSDADVPEQEGSLESENDAAGDSDAGGGVDGSQGPGTTSGQNDEIADSSAATGEAADEPVSDGAQGSFPAGEEESAGADQDMAAESDSDRRDDGVARFQEPTLVDDESGGRSTLDLVLIGLGIVSVVLLIVGFVIPRWWRSSARGS